MLFDKLTRELEQAITGLGIAKVSAILPRPSCERQKGRDGKPKRMYHSFAVVDLEADNPGDMLRKFMPVLERCSQVDPQYGTDSGLAWGISFQSWVHQSGKASWSVYLEMETHCDSLKGCEKINVQKIRALIKAVKQE